MSAADHLSEQQFKGYAKASHDVGSGLHALGGLTKEGSRRSQKLHEAGDKAHKIGRVATGIGSAVHTAMPLIKFAGKLLEDTAEAE